MFPGMGGRGNPNPKQLDRMMKQMGIDMREIDDVEEVVIRTRTKDIVITDASVQRVTAQGSTSWQVTGDAVERPRQATKPQAAPSAPTTQSQAPGPKFTEDDVALVAEQAKVPKDKARKALEECDGEPAEAILKLTGG